KNVRFNLSLEDREIGAGKLGPATAIEVVHVLGNILTHMVSVPAADDGTFLVAGIANGFLFHYFGAAQERLTVSFGPFGEPVAPVKFLQKPIDTVAYPG